MATYAQFKHVELYKIGHGKNRVPNAPKSCIAEIFSTDSVDSRPITNGSSRPRAVRDTPTRPRDTHARLFGQGASHSVAPMVTDNIRSHIQFGEFHMNGGSPTLSPSKQKLMNGNGSASSTPSRGEPELGAHFHYGPPKRNPVTGVGVMVATPRRPHPAVIAQRGASSFPHLHTPDPLLEPQPTHRYYTRDWPPRARLTSYYVRPTTKPTPNIQHTPYTLLGLKNDDPEISQPVIDPDSLSPQQVLHRNWPLFPAQHKLEPKEKKNLQHLLIPHSFVGLTSALGERPQPDYKYNPIPSLDSPIDPYLIANCNPSPTLFKYERDGPIPDFTLLQTEAAPPPRTLTGFPPIFHKHVPGYLFRLDRDPEDFRPKTYYVDYVRRREMESNPITGTGYKSNGQINNVTSVSGATSPSYCRVPPGGYSSRLW